MGIRDIFKRNKGIGPKSALKRKRESEKLLKSLDIPYLEDLPLIEEAHEVKLRTAAEIAERMLILTYLNYRKDVPEQKEELIKFLRSHSLWEKVSPKEKEQFLKEELTHQEIINISWRSEAIWLLLWAIKKVDKLELPIEQVQVKEILARLPDLLEDPEVFC